MCLLNTELGPKYLSGGIHPMVYLSGLAYIVYIVDYPATAVTCSITPETRVPVPAPHCTARQQETCTPLHS